MPRVREIALAASLLFAWAGAWQPEPAAGSPAGFAFLEIPAGARAAALGGAYSSVGWGVEALFWNPAGLQGVKRTQITGTHAEYFQALKQDYFAIAGRQFGGGLGTSLRALYTDPIEERDELGNLIGSFGSHDLEFALGYGTQAAPGLFLGGTAEVVRERIADAAATTYAFNLGGLWEPAAVKGLRLAASAHNLGPSPSYDIYGVPGAAVPLPSAVQAGGSWRAPLGRSLQLLGALEGRFTRGRSGIGMLGAELASAGGQGAALRLGWRLNDDATSWSAGVGYAFPALRVDYAFVPGRLDLGDTHRFSFSTEF